MNHLKDQSLTNIFQSSSLLQGYVSKTKSLKKLTYIIRQYLEPELAKNCAVANLIDNELILTTTSPTWNHQLRFLIPDLRCELRKLPQFHKLAKIKIIQDIPITKNVTKAKPLKPATISAAACKQITNTVKHITNKDLAKALLKITEHSSA